MLGSVRFSRAHMTDAVSSASTGKEPSPSPRPLHTHTHTTCSCLNSFIQDDLAESGKPKTWFFFFFYQLTSLLSTVNLLCGLQTSASWIIVSLQLKSRFISTASPLGKMENRQIVLFPFLFYCHSAPEYVLAHHQTQITDILQHKAKLTFIQRVSSLRTLRTNEFFEYVHCFVTVSFVKFFTV